MFPIIRALKSLHVPHAVVTTGQHDSLLNQALEMFRIRPKIRCHRGCNDNTLVKFMSTSIKQLERVFDKLKPNAVLAQGDTASVLATAQVCFLKKIPFGHVEAGLRTYNYEEPWPEEYFRRVVSLTARWNFAPTYGAQLNLEREGVDTKRIYNVGNPVVDALQYILKKAPVQLPLINDRKYVLITAHRRENIGEPLQNICKAIRQLAQAYPTIEFRYPVHPNPDIKTTVMSILAGPGNTAALPNIILLEPLNYVDFIHQMAGAEFIMTDSGGAQEEAVSLEMRALVLRNTTERPEGLTTGCRLVGTNVDSIVSAFEETCHMAPVTKGRNPYGDGTSGEQIARILMADLNIAELKERLGL